jgi:alkyl sulfatase BDS1-like metallo-beta-lactamase superfamily hydrolase
MSLKRIACAALAALSLLSSSASAQSPADATPATAKANQAVLQALPFANRQDFEDAQRGLVARWPGGVVKAADGHVVWNLNTYAFIAGEAPPTVNPSLWRQALLNMDNGLYKVTDRIYQVRGMDLSNMTIVEGDRGIIVIDPLISTEVAKASLDLYREHRGNRPVVAVIYTHSHIDHYGGVKGVVSEADVRSGKVRVLAPEGFLEHAVSENVYAGNAMSRRATYMYGALLPRSARGQVDAGLGKTTSLGTVTLIPPTDIIRKTGEKRTIDGVDIVFQMAPGTEAPAEMLFYFPQMRALCAAEDMTHTLHNLYTLRGAEVRDAQKWWQAIDYAIHAFGGRTDVIFASHHWPMWGQARISTFMHKQRNLYKYLLDQTLRLINHGLTMNEVAEQVRLPRSLADEWYNRGYYGTVSHDVKAIYQKYIGWYDGNPAHLHPLPPVETAKRYVEYMGGGKAVVERARASYAKGEYRWVAQVLSDVVLAEPDNVEARALEADALEQLGYQAESGPWRCEYLMGAYELRNGVPASHGQGSSSADVLSALTLPMYFDYMGIRLNGPKAEGKHIVLNWRFTDSGEKVALELEDSALLYQMGAQAANPDATLTLARTTLDDITLRRTTLQEAMANGRVKVAGNPARIAELFGLLDTFQPTFPIVTPR